MQPTIPTRDDDALAVLSRLSDEHQVTELLGALEAAVDGHDDAAERACWLHDSFTDGSSGATSFSMQFRSDGHITVEGGRATAESLVIAPTTVEVDATAVGQWRTWRQTAELVRTDSGWRIRSLDREPIISARYEDGWGSSD